MNDFLLGFFLGVAAVIAFSFACGVLLVFVVRTTDAYPEQPINQRPATSINGHIPAAKERRQ